MYLMNKFGTEILQKLPKKGREYEQEDLIAGTLSGGTGRDHVDVMRQDTAESLCSKECGCFRLPA
jgi:hypothetical protein